MYRVYAKVISKSDHFCFFRERAKDLMPPGQESIVILVDYKSTTLRTNPSISVASKVLNILQQHYVETLGRAIVVNLPLLLNFFYKGISPFLDPVTRDKVCWDELLRLAKLQYVCQQMRFNPDLFELIPRSQLDADFGGEHTFAFDPESYWNQIVAFVFSCYLIIIKLLTFPFPFRACGIAPDGTRVDFPPKSNSEKEDLDTQKASGHEIELLEEELGPPSLIDEKAPVDVSVMGAVELDDINTLPKLVS